MRPESFAPMLGSTIVLNDGTERTLVKINQDSYGSEYLLRGSGFQYVAKIRHSTTKANSDGLKYDRHNFEVVKTTFGTSGAPDTYLKFYFVMEALPSESAVALSDAVADLAIASANSFLNDLNGWQS